MIVARGLEKAYDDGTPVLQGLDLEVPEGGFVAVVGPSGSGKSTLLNVLGGLDTAYRGTVSVAGRILGDLDDEALSSFRNRTVAFVFQAFNLVAPLTALENVALPAWFDPAAPGESELRRRGLEALERVGLAHKADRPPDHLSGGERQRVAIARALMMRPRLLLCDEPTGNLDRRTGEEIVEVFESLHQEGLTLVMVTHEARVSERAQAVYRLESGRLVPGLPGEGAR